MCNLHIACHTVKTTATSCKKKAYLVKAITQVNTSNVKAARKVYKFINEKKVLLKVNFKL